ncbi:hypothetical protein [Amycolatopsis vastitatis]|uniref:PknH-like extracellular domain-containing protein n=1 Tax=Amycolatopsis vastitatis TaxID=1905142 RepID=A0A229SR93_9PSEU|nr:hypothetical protein [Amycolatopsis vastitatis]OXM61595.1 hypothetical protein CF165_37410 [Amycolatopsis vastitatis]
MASAGLLVLLTACSATPPAADPLEVPSLESIVVDGIRPIGDSTSLPLPIDPYQWSDSDTRTMGRALDRAAGRCLSGFGLAMPVTPAMPDVGPASVTARRYGLTSGSEAATSGYRLKAAMDAGPRPAPSPPDPEVAAVLRGTTGRVGGRVVPAGGCAGQAAAELGAGARPGAADLVQDINTRSWELSRTHPVVTAAFRAWSACMKKAGADYPDPMAAMNDRRFTGVPSPREIAVARADVACKTATNTTGIWYAAEVAVQRKMIERNQSALDVAKRVKNDQLALARKTLAAP